MRRRLGQIENLEQRFNLSGLGNKLPDLALLHLQTRTHTQSISQLQNSAPITLTDTVAPSTPDTPTVTVSNTDVLVRRTRPTRHLDTNQVIPATDPGVTDTSNNGQNNTPVTTVDSDNNGSPSDDTTTTLGNQPQEFQVAALNAVGYQGQNNGFNVANVEVQSTDPNSSVIDLTPRKTSETVIDSTHILQVWKTDNGEAEIDATLTQTGGDTTMNVTVIAGQGWTINSVDLGAPEISVAQHTADLRTYSAFRGGQVQDWPATGWSQQNSSVWPNMGYSPIGVFYDAKTTEGVGFVSFDSGLKSRAIYWYTGPTQIYAFVRWDAAIAGGQSASTTVALHHDLGMPTNHFQYYRDNFLVPFMNSQGVQEGSLNMSGVIGMSGWPINGDVSSSVNWSKSWGATGYLQYAPPDGSLYYEPDPETMSWYPTLKAASQTPGLTGLGVLIDPFEASHSTSPTTDPTSPNWFPGGWGEVSLSDPNVQNYLTRMKTDLVNQGVNFAFWDGGHGPRPGQEMEWFDVLKDWKNAGISIAPETSNDLAAYVTGTELIDQLGTYDYSLLKTVTPNAKPLMEDWGTTPASNGQYWWDTATNLGFIPVLSEAQLPIYGAEHGFTGPT